MLKRSPPAISASLAAVLLALAAAACGDGSDEPSPTAQPSSAASPTAVATASTSPGASPTAVSFPAGPSPRVLWMIEERSGATTTIRLATDVPTLVQLTAFAGVGQDAGFPAQTTTSAGTLHIISAPAAPKDVAYTVEVRDAAGKKATATLESGVIVGTQFWLRGADSPKLTMLANRGADVAWTNLRPAPNETTQAGIVLLARPVGCNAAQAGCAYTPVSTSNEAAPAAGGDPAVERHALSLTFPDSAHDYMLVLAGRLANGTAAFYMFDVKAGALK